MTWTHIARSSGLGTEEKWLLRSDGPLASLQKNDVTWQANLLHLTGIGCGAVLHLSSESTLEEAKAAVEAELLRMGWRW